ncbi:hypothetical protein TVAG_013740 [Trichomonas vaginalis G3]|uniref:Uncharacterized protein n=1 Tax=Trichomonas vaginalis (strain ATCC PRA-98 / G3) TaxID=412133 RepID=A2DDD0_TRIV3|nr:TAG-278-related family [Trichomonas vaginalis G3]EAY21609.1 hypothetical protein TVAG_013740 [Trichomonas vaginalis G3]KAI5489715.1 TAG-278-related family [Trichomonas vaginalis G3]|eukprot:XP_001582595.1 hypothetical protein [Trichomonas vaginalis G3]
MSLAARAIRFNVSKKISQLMKVISLFSSQLAEKKHQKEYLENYYNQIWADLASKYEKDITPILQEASTCNSTISNEISELFNSKFNELHHSFMVNQQNLSDQVNQTFIQSQSEISKFVAEITEISSKLLRNQSAYANCAVRIGQILEDPSLKQKYLKELQNIEEESTKKYNEYEKQADARLKELNDNHLKEMKALNSRYMEDTPELIKFNEFLKETRSRVSINKDILKISSDKYQEVSQDHYFNDLQAKINSEISNLINSKETYKEKLQSKRDRTEKLELMHNEMIKKLTEELKAIKASNELKLQKMCRETEEVLKNFRDEEKKLLDEQYASLGSYDASIQQLQKQYIEEEEALKQKIESTENVTKKLLNEKEKLILETQKSFEMEEEMLQRDNSQLISRNQQLLKNATANMKTMEENTVARYRAILLQMRSDFEKKLISDNTEISNARANLQKFKEEKDTQISIVKQKSNNFDLETNNINTIQKQKFLDAETNLESTLNQKYQDYTNERTQKLSFVEKSNSMLENKRREELAANYDKEIENIKKENQENTEISRSEERYKKEYEELKKQLDSITPPANKSFATYDKTIKDITNTISKTKLEIEDEKINMKNQWNTMIENEIKRHTDTSSSGSSGRAKEQVKKNLMNRIQEIAAETEEESRKLQDKLKQIMAKHMNDIVELESKKLQISNEEEIKKLQIELDYQIKRCDELISEAKRQSKKETAEFQMKIENMKNDNDSRILTLENDSKFMENKIKKKLEDMRISISLISQKEKEEASKIKAAIETTISQENQSFQYHSKEINDEISKQQLKIQQTKKDSDDTIRHRIESNNYELQKFESKLVDENENVKDNWQALELFYNEKIEVLEKKRDDLIEKFNTRPGRASDLERIELLTGRLKIILTQLKNNTRDLVEYKKLLIVKEKEYNEKFGRKPNVGVLIE